MPDAAFVSHPDPPPATWIVDLEIGGPAGRVGACPPDRDAFFEWLWEQCGDAGLQGVFEGAVDVDEAAARGLVASPRVLDAAAAPSDRDWVGKLAPTRAACWFEDEASARAAAALLAAAGGCAVCSVRRETSRDAGGDWRAAFGAIDVPGFGTIRPAWDEGEAESTAAGTTIFIEPGSGFGTGLHETTQLCLMALEAWQAERGRLDRVVDVGSGSGILGIAAAVRGSSRVSSVEIDPRVHAAIRDNARRNGVADRVTVMESIPADATAADLVFANIVAAVLLEHAEAICRQIRRGANGRFEGCLVLSGLLAADVEPVSARYARVLDGLPLQTSLGDWHCLRFSPAAADQETSR